MSIHSLWTVKIFSLCLILIVTIIAGLYPFIKKRAATKAVNFPIGESLAAGVFLGAGLLHMLGDASAAFNQLHFQYPIAFLLAGGTFLVLLLLEHIGVEIYHHRGSNSNAFAILAVLMLSFHSFLAGAALGLSNNFSMALIILLAIVAHKWAASFSIAVRITSSQLKLSHSIILFAFFALMVPSGILMGSAVNASLSLHPLLEPIFSSLAAGTFIYLGTLHGLEKATLIQQCCKLNRFFFVIMGFAIMAIVAIWT